MRSFLTGRMYLGILISALFIVSFGAKYTVGLAEKHLNRTSAARFCDIEACTAKGMCCSPIDACVPCTGLTNKQPMLLSSAKQCTDDIECGMECCCWFGCGSCSIGCNYRTAMGNAKCNPSDGYQSNPQCKWPTDCCHVFQALPGDVNSEIGICDSCNIGAYPPAQKDFAQVCRKNNCVCKGYPNPNYRHAILKGRVSLEQCSQACRKRKFCFGFEFWDRKDGNSANCFECPTFPNKKYTIKVVASGSASSRKYSTVFQKISTNMRTQIGPYCGQEHKSCGRSKKCCQNLKCIKGKCQRRKACFLGTMTCPRGWYCSGLRGGCRKCQPKHNKEPTKCRNNYLGGRCNANDQRIADINEGKDMLKNFRGCIGMFCKTHDCVSNCMRKYGFSDSCLWCFGNGTKCIVDSCTPWECGLGSEESCTKCVKKECMPTFTTCSGLSFVLDEKLVEKLQKVFK